MRIYPTKRQLRYLDEIGVFLTESDRKKAVQNQASQCKNNIRRQKSYGELTGEFIRTHIKTHNLFWILLQILLFIVVIAVLT